MDADDGHQVGVAGLVEVVEERAVLVVVGVEVLLRQLQVGLDEVGEHLDVQIDALPGHFGFDELEDFRVGYRGCANHQLFARMGGEGDDGGENGECLFHFDCSWAVMDMAVVGWTWGLDWQRAGCRR
ncbi:hypothetical protein D9M71_579620 [compost metagenome]